MTGEVREFRLVELARRLANVVRPGVVAEADHALARVRVKYGEEAEAVSAWLPWLAGRAGGDLEWWAPEIGEQVLILAPSGELANGIVIAGLYSDARPAPASSSDRHVTRYIDGAEIEYDREAHRLKAVLPEGGTAEITAPDGRDDHGRRDGHGGRDGRRRGGRVGRHHRGRGYRRRRQRRGRGRGRGLAVDDAGDAHDLQRPRARRAAGRGDAGAGADPQDDVGERPCLVFRDSCLVMQNPNARN